MNQRIIDGMILAGKTPVDVTATLETLLGPIPAACRAGGGTPPDDTTPSVQVTAPSYGATVGGAVKVRAQASDLAGVVGVQFHLDGHPLGAEDTTAPYETQWETTQSGNGSHTLTAVARDAAGNRGEAAHVPVTVANVGEDTTPPTIAITVPTASAVVAGAITVDAHASDNVGIVGVQYTLDGAALLTEQTQAPWDMTWQTTTITDGAHTLTAVARDAAGNRTTSAPVAVTVANAAPPPALTCTGEIGTWVQHQPTPFTMHCVQPVAR
jgi:YD repeat-containing protein